MSTDKGEDIIKINIDNIDPESIQRSNSVIQKDALDRLLNILKDDSKKGINSNTSIYRSRIHNTIFINGKRGSGKTLFLLSIEKSIKNNEDFKNLYFFHPIDPTLLHTSESFLTIIIAQMLNSIEEDRIDILDRDRFFKLLSKLSEALDGILKDGYKNSSSIENISKDQTSLRLEEHLHEFFGLISSALGKKRLVLLIDDVDMAFNKGFEVLEVVRKYLSSPFVIPIITGDLELYETIIENNFIKKIDKSMQKQYRKKIKIITKDYLTKVLPGHRRINIDNLYTLSNYYHIDFKFNNFTYRLRKLPISDNNNERGEYKYFREIVKEKALGSDRATEKFIENLFSNPLRNIMQFLHGEYKKNNREFSLDRFTSYKRLEYDYNISLLKGVFTWKTYLEEGLRLFIKRDFLEALKNFNESLKLERRGDTLYYLGNTYLEIKAIEEAIRYFKEAIELGFREESLLALGGIYIKRHDYSKALEYFLEAEAFIRDRKDAKASYNIGLAYLNLGDRKKAESYFKNAIEYDGEFYKPYIGIREVYFLDHKDEHSIEEYIRDFGIKNKKREIQALYSMYDILDVIFKDIDKYQDALEYWKKEYEDISPIDWNFDALDSYAKDIKNEDKQKAYEKALITFKEYLSKVY